MEGNSPDADPREELDSIIGDIDAAHPALDEGRRLRVPRRARRGDKLDERLDDAVAAAVEALLRHQRADGHWCFELEADCTIPAEYILMMHFMDEIDAPLQAKLCVYLRTRQNPDGGWSLYSGGRSDLSCTVKVYYALKLAGEAYDAPRMRYARAYVLGHGGAARANVFTRYTLALFGQLPWRGVPFVPVEIVLLPRWFPFHLSKVSYWSRAVMVPLSVLVSLKAQARNPLGLGIQELFVTPPARERRYFRVRSVMNFAFLALERSARLMEPLIPARLRRRALRTAEHWVIERLNGVEGLGAIFPAMVNAHEMLARLGYPPEHPCRLQTRAALRKLIVVGEDSAYCQPCVSPVWDSALAALALEPNGGERQRAAGRGALDWLAHRQLRDQPGDWRAHRPRLAGGGWPFQYANDHYPDLDDTAVVAWAMLALDRARYRDTIERAACWLSGMQSKNGGFAAFDADNTYYYLNHIPFADHGALLDPPTADVTARVVTFLARYDAKRFAPVIGRALVYLRRAQEGDGAWFGRWGSNYIYGTWSVLAAFEAAGVSADDPTVRRAVDWLMARQREDGGWGESNDSYERRELAGRDDSSRAFHTAWALLGLMAAGEAGSFQVRRGVEYLLRRQTPEGLWSDAVFTAPGFPRVFYLKYHGYDKYFPLWALTRYRQEHKTTRDVSP